MQRFCDVKGGAALVAGKVPQALVHPVELGNLQGVLGTLKVWPPSFLAKFNELFLTLLSWQFYDTCSDVKGGAALVSGKVP